MMNKEMLDIEIVIAVDSDGNYTVGSDLEETVERHADDNGTRNCVQVYSFVTKIARPDVVELGEVTIPPQNEQYELNIRAIAN